MWELEYSFEFLQSLFGREASYISRNAEPLNLEKLTPKWRGIIEEAIRFIHESAVTQPTPLTPRQVHYHLVHQDIGYRNTETDNDILEDYLVRARIGGLIPWDSLVELESLITEAAPSGMRDPEEAIKQALTLAEYSVGVNPWEKMGKYLIVITEKRELYPQLDWICDKYYVRLVCPRGEAPWARLYKESLWVEEKVDNGFEVITLFVTDHDPTGLEINRFVWSALKNWFRLGFTGKRLMLTIQQAKTFILPPIPTKVTDKRSPAYVKIFGDEAWEVDALGRERMQQLLEEEIKKHIDWKTWQDVEKANNEARERIRQKVEELLQK